MPVLCSSPPFPSPLLRPPGRPAARHPARPVRPRGRASQLGGLDARGSRVWGSADFGRLGSLSRLRSAGSDIRPREACQDARPEKGGAEPQTRTSRLRSRAVCPVPASGPVGLAVGRPAGRAGLLGVVVRRRLLAVVAVRGWWSWVSVVAGCRVVAVWAFRRCGVCGCAGRSCVAVVGWSVNRLGLGRTPAARGVLGRAAGKGRKETPDGKNERRPCNFHDTSRNRHTTFGTPQQKHYFPLRQIRSRPGSKRAQVVWGSPTRVRVRSQTMARRVGPGPSAPRWSGGPQLVCGSGPIRWRAEPRAAREPVRSSRL